MKGDIARLDAPLDYHVLWQRLKLRLETIAAQQAVMAATAKEDLQVRKAQGSYDMAKRVVAEMSLMVEQERGSESPDLGDDDTLQ